MTDEIKVNPDWIIWSRKTLNYTTKEASKKLKISEKTLLDWEESGLITYKNMNRLANLYDVSPLLFLNNSPPPKIAQYIKDYRTMNDKKIRTNPMILKEIKHAKRKRLLLLDLADELNRDLSFKYYQEKAPNKKTIVSIIRDSLELNAMKLNEYTVDDWIRAFESLNILIFNFYNIKPEDIRGYAFNNEKLPIIGINNRSSDKEKIFSLFNEYAHILIGKDGISGDYNKEKQEKLCNSIAAEILLPEREIKKIHISNVNTVIRIVSTRYNVGMENILYRLKNLNYLTDEELEQQLIKRVYNPVEDDKQEDEIPEEVIVNTKDNSKPKKKRNYKQQHLKTMASKNINHNGHLYIELLLEAYDQELIDDLDLSSRLEIPHTVIPYVINKLNGA